MRTSLEHLSDTELLTRMLASGEGAWREFYRRFDRLVWLQIHRVTACFSKVLGEFDLEEIHANFYASLVVADHHKLRAWDPAKGAKLGTWLALLASNACHDYLRSVARRPRYALLSDLADTLSDGKDLFDRTAARRDCERLEGTLERMGERDRTLLLMLFVDESSPAEVAARFSMPVKTVYTRCHRLRAALRRQRDPRPLAA